MFAPFALLLEEVDLKKLGKLLMYITPVLAP